MLLSVLLSHRLLQPVRELTQAAKRLAGGDLAQRVRPRGSDEVGVLGSTFNQMAGSLQAAEESRKAMTADIAHELRTPLSVQRAHLEALQDGIYPLTAENLSPVLEQNHLLTRLVDDLRTLALADSGQLQLERSNVDLMGLARDVIERFRPQFENRGVELSLEPGELPPVRVDPQRIEQILGNLLSNALRHTPAGGWVQVRGRLIQSGRVIHLEVRDSGPGIPPEALEQIFERFYRADKSRSRPEGGSGLGLAIARQLAEAHGGRLQAENHPEGGAVIRLTLPVAPMEG
jgi:signal transduction histidine kinase